MTLRTISNNRLVDGAKLDNLPAVVGDISGSGTANEIAYFTAEKTIDNLPVATYPSLTELAYVKGTTSSIQTQLGNKQPLATVLTNTTASFTTAQETKLSGIAAGAEVNVNADWNAVSGDAQILNKPSIPTQYTDEMAQDAVGNAVGSGLDYDDATGAISVDKTELSLVKGDVGLGNVDNTSDANKPVSTAQQTALDGKVDENAAITGATKTKITYDAKGLVTSGANATTADIADSTNKRYVSDAQLTVLGNTSGTNTGDNATNTTSNAYADGKVVQTITNGVTTTAPSEDAVYDALAGKQANLVSGTNIKTINGTTILGSGDLTIAGAGGDVTGPASAVGDNIAVYNSTTGKIIKDGGAKVSDLATVTNLALKAPIASPTFTGTVTTPDIRTGLIGVAGATPTTLNPFYVNIPNSGAFVLNGEPGVNNSAAMKWFSGGSERSAFTYDDLSNNLRMYTISGDIKLFADNINDRGITIKKGTGSVQVPTIELGHATDTTLSRVSAGVIAVEGVTIPTISSTDTLTNKRQNPRVVSAASYTTDTGTSLSIATCDMFEITAQAGALKFNNPGGTPVDGNTIKVRIKDNGTARALTYDTQFRAIGTTLPTTTVISKTLYMGFIYNSADTKRDCIATAQEA